MSFGCRSVQLRAYSLEIPSPQLLRDPQRELSDDPPPLGQPQMTGQSVVEARREEWVHDARPIAVRSPRQAESKRPPHYMHVPHFLQPHSKPVEYRSVNSQSPAESRSWQFAVLTTPLA